LKLKAAKAHSGAGKVGTTCPLQIFHHLKIYTVTATEIFIEFEKMAIAWGKAHQIAKVGDIVTSNLGGKRPKKLQISHVWVSMGRNAQITTRKTFTIGYAGRRLNAKGGLIDEIGTGRILYDFLTADGKAWSHAENEVTETMTDSGLSFTIDFDPECKEKYPNAYASYAEPFHPNPYTR
jgi:hypothetical protein